MEEKKNLIEIDFVTQAETPSEASVGSPLLKTILGTLERSGATSSPVARLAFDEDPWSPNKYAGLYYQKLVCIPDDLLKTISITDSLVGSILMARSNHMSAFGVQLEDKHDFGFRIGLKKSAAQLLTDEQKQALRLKIRDVSNKLVNCGETTGWNDLEKMQLSEFMFKSARNACLFGRFATDIIWRN